MESADVPKMSFIPRKQVRGAAVPLKSWISWGPYQIKAHQICEWKRDGLWFKARRVWKNMHIRSIFLQSLRKHSVASFRATVPIPHLPPAIQLRARGAVVFTSDCHKTRSASTQNYWNRFRWKREMPRDLPPSWCTPLPPYSQTKDHPHCRLQKRYGNPPAGGRTGIQTQCLGNFRNSRKI